VPGSNEIGQLAELRRERNRIDATISKLIKTTRANSPMWPGSLGCIARFCDDRSE
jgi:hypothetical protein